MSNAFAHNESGGYVRFIQTLDEPTGKHRVAMLQRDSSLKAVLKSLLAAGSAAAASRVT